MKIRDVLVTFPLSRKFAGFLQHELHRLPVTEYVHEAHQIWRTRLNFSIVFSQNYTNHKNGRKHYSDVSVGAVSCVVYFRFYGPDQVYAFAQLFRFLLPLGCFYYHSERRSNAGSDQALRVQPKTSQTIDYPINRTNTNTEIS